MNSKIRTLMLVTLTTLAARPIAAQVQGPGATIRLNGVNQYVSIAHTGSVRGTFTLEMWARPNHPNAILGLLGSRSTGEYSFDVKFMDGTRLHADIGNGTLWLNTTADARAFSMAV